ncbi:unnamed protein product [Effrenium voratum]|uniref:tRNA-uridine aminocarboxypropyltransferase n=1 Tax=Effrenium voratum TaxID=2562239 RepID=A0AA36IIP1_9DINO|nr:unnamed protein product [Effrenium voratum]
MKPRPFLVFRALWFLIFLGHLCADIVQQCLDGEIWAYLLGLNRWSLLLQVADQGCLLPEPPSREEGMARLVEPMASPPALAEDRARSPSRRFQIPRALTCWRRYCDFLADPGVKCPRCWRVAQHCCCESMRPVQLRPRILVLFHHEELGQHSATNTAVLLTLAGLLIGRWVHREGTLIPFEGA